MAGGCAWTRHRLEDVRKYVLVLDEAERKWWSRAPDAAEGVVHRAIQVVARMSRPKYAGVVTCCLPQSGVHTLL